MVDYNNKMKMEFDSKSKNEAFARVVVSAFASQLDPTIEELSDIKTAVSEAVTNAIIHGYENKPGTVYLNCYMDDSKLTIVVTDKGKGIENIEQARQPLYTSKPELERSGMGFTVMEAFMNHIEIESTFGEGTTITMIKELQSLKVE